MFSKYLYLSTAFLSLSSAVPTVKRDGCTPGLFNCIDGKSFAQCTAGGTWSVTMPVSAGTSCNIGIAVNPFLPANVSAGPRPPPAASAPSAPAPTPARLTPADPSKDLAPIPQSPAPPAVQNQNTTRNPFPPTSVWLSWEALQSRYTNIMGQSCTSSGWGANNNAEESVQIITSIKSIAITSGLDPRFLLATTIQESSGCVRVVTTNNGVRNPGLLQSSNGQHTCNEVGYVLNPCPEAQINGMVADGVQGGSNNLVSAMAQAKAAGFEDSFAYAVAARIYNSGSFDPNDLSNGLGSTNTYVESVMGRLVGAKL